MNEIEQGKENFQKALLDVCKDYLENLELAPEEDVFISPKLQRKMNRLLKDEKKPYRKLINAPYKRVIAACLAAAVLAGSLISCSTIREPIFEFFTEVYEKFTEFFFGHEDKEAALKGIEEVHTFTYVPNGYELIERPILTGEDSEIRTVWENTVGDRIIFYQMILTGKITLDTESSQIKIVSNEIQVTIVPQEEKTFVFWNDDTYSYALRTSNLSEDEIIKIIKSIKSIK